MENARLLRQLRDGSDPFKLPKTLFIKTFRLNAETTLQLIDKILLSNPNLEPKNTLGIPFHLKFLAALHFFGHGNYQKPTADNRLFAMSQSSVSRSISIVTKELVKLAEVFIKFPTTNEEIASTKMHFLSKLRMPGIIGAIDGCHIAIQQPSAKKNGYLYYNRKRYYSLNMLAVCDANMRITYADASFPGSVHDSAIWSMSDLKSHIQRQHITGNRMEVINYFLFILCFELI